MIEMYNNANKNKFGEIYRLVFTGFSSLLYNISFN